MKINNTKLAVIGLGYVGLPLAVEFSKKINVIGFDINESRVSELCKGKDSTFEVNEKELVDRNNLKFTNNINLIKECNVFIVTVPTPIDEFKQPDLNPLVKASNMLGKIIKKNDIVIYESTVYPGATEEICIPEIEKMTKLKFNKDFFVGYSPERINPGDKKNKLTNIIKVTSGSNEKTAEFVDDLYNTIINVGTYKATSIKVAEASKIIENVQRDVNIALINEIHQLLTNMKINTDEVIKAASTKWNFMNLKPGLVGGHCIGVDPYYLLHKSNVMGYIPDLMRKGREINDGMPSFIVNQFIQSLLVNKKYKNETEIALVGFTFKENCPDIRNTKIVNIYELLLRHGFNVKIYDPLVNCEEVKKEYKLTVENELNEIKENIIFLCVKHEIVMQNLKNLKNKFIFDFQNINKY